MLELLLNSVLTSLHKINTKILIILNLLLILNGLLILNITAELKTAVKLNIAVIIVRTLIVIMEAFETINNAVIIIKVA